MIPPFRTPDIIKYGDAPHAQEETASSPITDVTLGNPRPTSGPDPDAPASSLAQDTSEKEDEQRAKRARQESDDKTDPLRMEGEKPPLSKPLKGQT